MYLDCLPKVFLILHVPIEIVFNPRDLEVFTFCKDPCSRFALIAGGTPAVPVVGMSGERRCEAGQRWCFALRAHCGRDARGPSRWLEWFICLLPPGLTTISQSSAVF
jgi:hypothetical protein